MCKGDKMAQLVLLSALVLSVLGVIAPDSNQPTPPQSSENSKADPNTEAKTLQQDARSPIAIPNLQVNSTADHVATDGSKESSGTDTEDEHLRIARANAEEQSRVADAAWGSLFLSILQLVVGIVTLIFLYFTLRGTTRAATAAEKSAEQAAASAKAGEESARAATVSAEAAEREMSSNRACIGIEGIHDRQRGDHAMIWAQWANYGRAPAVVLGVCTKFAATGAKDPAPPFTPEMIPFASMKLGPGHKFPCFAEKIDQTTRDAIFADSKIGWLYSRLEYRDVSDPTTKWEEGIYRVTAAITKGNLSHRWKEGASSTEDLFLARPWSWESSDKAGPAK